MALLAMVAVALWRTLPHLGPVPPEGLYNSDSALPVLMANLATGAPVDWLLWGQDRFGSWAFLLFRAGGAVLGRAWTPHGLHVARVLWMTAALVPWLALAGRAGLVAAAGWLLLPALNPLLGRALVDLGTVDGWQLPALLWAWWGLREAAVGARPWRWLALATVAGALATWTSLVSAPLLLVLAGVEGRGRGLGRVRAALLALPAVAGALLESAVRASWHAAVRARGWPDLRTPARLDVGHLGENLRQVISVAWGVGAVPWLVAALAAGLLAVVVVPWREEPERRTVLGAVAASLVALAVVVAVKHVRDNGYNPRYLGVALGLAVLSVSVAAGLAVRRALLRGWPREEQAALAVLGLGAVVLLAPVAGPDPRATALGPAAREIASRYRGAALVAGYWRTYALAALLPPGTLVPVPRDGEWNRRPDWVEALGDGRPVLVGRLDSATAAPGELVQRGVPLVLVAPDVLLLPPFPGESTGERLSVYRRAAAGH